MQLRVIVIDIKYIKNPPLSSRAAGNQSQDLAPEAAVPEQRRQELVTGSSDSLLIYQLAANT